MAQHTNKGYSLCFSSIFNPCPYLPQAIWPYSGHYLPTEDNFKEFISFLEEHQVDLTNVKVITLKRLYMWCMYIHRIHGTRTHLHAR